MTSLLAKVRELLKTDKSFTLLEGNDTRTDNIAKAQIIRFGDEKLSLDEPTDFELEGKQVPLRVIIHCWLHRDSSAADYLADCQDKQTTNVSFLQRNDLINWLSGRLESSQYINLGSSGSSQGPDEADREREQLTNGTKQGTEVTDSSVQNGKKDDLALAAALSQERPLLDHNSSLRGNRLVNVGYLIKDAELKLVQSLKASIRSKKSQNGTSHGRVVKTAAASRSGPRKEPIILIPSAASSIFTMANIQQFLRDSHYINPRDLPASHSDFLTVEKKLDRLSRPVKFIVVNNTRMFTKPEYWDRVVAVITMGHTWQFNNYQWNTPQELFQHCKGYYFHFAGDSVPQHVQQWNVQQVELDKSKRFKDVEVARFFWNSLEKELTARGFH
ncbi:hypothetical protein HG536_0C02130 [Torulaspora globosa]|uniref:Cell division control protein 73 C-terminal domain-containing protein n=1 Tax=Torulaspora globosa TaxID=48254 RepID=A0A7G3ZEV8_9SACH|nr:uncharacterized protein HG536_0C02130 [Torulaspora globosa]QLL32044.1 hypothetical protein HG536_0C02130 [Torulaspora globosa]